MIIEKKLVHGKTFADAKYFSGWNRLGVSFDHEIKLKDNIKDPPKWKIYPLDTEKAAVLKEQINKLLESR